MRITSVITFLLAALVSPAHGASPVVSVTTCGQVVPPNSRGVLTSDLDCTGLVGGIAITLEKGATLDLQTFTLSGGLFGVLCQGRSCEVTNGAVTGAAASGITGDRVTVRNVTATNNGDAGVQGYQLARAFDSTLAGNGLDGIHAWTVKVYRSTVTGNARFGVIGSKYSNGRYSRGIALRDSTVTGNGTAPGCDTAFNSNCADLSSGTRPRIQRTTCDTTHATVAVQGCGPHWCVCSVN